ncbi:MAG: IS66 family insertion sequence element accessory protein TnpB [Myxococcota bacterium]
MIGSTRNLSVYAHEQPTDMRKGYDGLFGLVREVIGQEPLSGHLFLFVAKNRRRAKVLFWDGTGLCIFQKRLERGRFVAPWARKDGVLTMTTSELSLFLGGSKAVRTSLSPPMLFSATI